MPLRFAPKPLGAIRERFAGRNLRTVESCPVRPSGILSTTVVPTVLFGQFQLSLPGSTRVNDCTAIGGLVGEKG